MATDRIIQVIGHLSELAEDIRQFDDGLQAHAAGHLSESDLGQMYDGMEERWAMLDRAFARVHGAVTNRRESWVALGKRREYPSRAGTGSGFEVDPAPNFPELPHVDESYARDSWDYAAGADPATVNSCAYCGGSGVRCCEHGAVR